MCAPGMRHFLGPKPLAHQASAPVASDTVVNLQVAHNSHIELGTHIEFFAALFMQCLCKSPLFSDARCAAVKALQMTLT